uniref:Uncharacterized protein n=1 Tax=Nelumbo nucifera TaxID=4432 RepID=A0A822YEU9_NELNU|nr:TPA_asm: hypothetical protein HUJ06_031014 [Nelumbo nucifera]
MGVKSHVQYYDPINSSHSIVSKDQKLNCRPIILKCSNSETFHSLIDSHVLSF